MDAASEPGYQGKDLATWICPLSGHDPNLAPSASGTTTFQSQIRVSFLIPSGKKLPSFCPQPGGLETPTWARLGCRCHLPAGADPSQSGLLELGVLLPPCSKSMDGCLELNHSLDSPPGVGAAPPHGPIPPPREGAPSPLLGSGHRPWIRRDAWPWRRRCHGHRCRGDGDGRSRTREHPRELSRPLPVLRDGLISQVSLLPRRNTRH